MGTRLLYWILAGPSFAVYFMRSMHGAVQGWDTLVRGTISQGRFVPEAQHPRTFGWGHIGRGHINPASHSIQIGSRSVQHTLYSSAMLPSLNSFDSLILNEKLLSLI